MSADNIGIIGVVLALVSSCLILVWVTRKPKGPAPSGKLHAYRSTACYHGWHDRCRGQCKFCCRSCDCPCHVSEPVVKAAAIV